MEGLQFRNFVWKHKDMSTIWKNLEEALLFFVFDQSYGFVDWVKVEKGNDKAWETTGKRAKDGAITRLQD
jgi:hypothetical protein